MNLQIVQIVCLGHRCDGVQEVWKVPDVEAHWQLPTSRSFLLLGFLLSLLIIHA